MKQKKDENHSVQHEFHGTESLFTLLQSLPDLIIFKDEAGRWIVASDYARILFGLDRSSYIGKTCIELAEKSPFYRDLFLSRQEADEQAWSLRKTTHSEVRFPHTDGSFVVLDMITTPLYHPDGSRKALVVIGRDTTERKRAEEHNYQLTYYDQLTSLPNRIQFDLELENLIKISKVLGQRFALLYLDMDRFRHINNSLGHNVGSQLLVCFAERIGHFIEPDWHLARLGGDEFAILIPNVSGIESARSIAQGLVQIIDATPFSVDQYQLFMTTSIGVCMFPEDSEDAHSLMKNAEIALYLAKEKGKNRYQEFNSKMEITAFRIFSLENSLNKAITLDQFEVYYQPKVDVVTHRIVGAEALIRWNHPEWGLVSPGEFIPLAEETGLIVPLGIWIKQTVCNQIVAWKEAGIEIVPVSVNISVKRFMQKRFIDSIEEILHETGLDPRFLEVEITETMFIENEHQVIDAINYLQDLGIKVSLDDFGTGYSSLSYLRKLKVNTIKIDLSFIKTIGSSEEADLILNGIIHLIKSLDINVIAEGVETEEQLRFLHQQKCDQAQGYLFSRPVNAEEFKRLLQKGTLDLKVTQCKDAQQIVNRRKYFRLSFTYPLLADMTIVNFMGKNVSLGKAEVLVENISLGGLCFVSNIKMAAKSDIVLSVETEIFGDTIKFIGKIIWFDETIDDLYTYGIEFIIDESEREAIASVLNLLTVKLRQNLFLPDCRFVMTNSKEYFRKKKK